MSAPQAAPNSPALLGALFDLLAGANLAVWLAGGWAEEALGLIPPRPHRDVDLLYPAPDFSRLDAFLRDHPELSEIAAKRFSHKRALVFRGVMVEFVLAQLSGAGYQTRFFGGPARLDWPPGSFDETAALGGRPFPVASPGALRAYRAAHPQIAAAYQEWVRV